jgi:hypothetical protein
MKAVASTSTADSAPAGKQQKAVPPVPVSPWVFEPPSMIDGAVVQRKGACACGGGCPGCLEKDQLPIQTKLSISSPGDLYEQEADRVADQIMRMPTPSPVEQSVSVNQPQISRVPAIHSTTLPQVQREEVIEEPLPEEEPKVVQTKGATGSSATLSPAFEPGLNSIRGGGLPLPESARAFFEPRFGRDFGHVRLHTDNQAAVTAASVNARAFTLGRNIVFGAGQYAPESVAGRTLLAHELTHVVQQADTESSVMRSPACDCAAVGARDPTAAEKTDASAKYPNLVDGDWCVTGSATPTYNCIAWTIGVTSRWVWNEVDTAGDGDGVVSIADFDAFYGARGLRPVVGATPAHPEVALFANSSGPTHAARISSSTCPGAIMFESKRGQNVRILHVVTQLEGGIYGNIVKFYVR